MPPPPFLNVAVLIVATCNNAEIVNWYWDPTYPTCCTEQKPCPYGFGDCSNDWSCTGDLKCNEDLNNCATIHPHTFLAPFWDHDCCVGTLHTFWIHSIATISDEWHSGHQKSQKEGNSNIDILSMGVYSAGPGISDARVITPSRCQPRHGELQGSGFPAASCYGLTFCRNSVVADNMSSPGKGYAIYDEYRKRNPWKAVYKQKNHQIHQN